MTRWSAWNSNHANSWAFPSVIGISNRNTVRRSLPETAQLFFYLTCDVTGGSNVNETWFPSTKLPGSSNTIRNFQIGTALGAQCKACSTPSIEVSAPLWNMPPQQPGKYAAHQPAVPTQ